LFEEVLDLVPVAPSGGNIAGLLDRALQSLLEFRVAAPNIGQNFLAGLFCLGLR